MRLDRLLAIVILLLNKDKITARELADKFEITVRTVYRDIDALSLAGIPIISYPGNNGGFGIMENYKLDHQLLSLSDMRSMLSALKGLNATFADNKIDAVIEKIKNLIPKDQKEKVLQQQIAFDILPWGYSEKQRAKLQIINEAIAQNKQIQLIYRNPNGEKNTRTVDPYTLLFKGYSWYLFAFCHLRKDFRLFRLSRIDDPQILDQVFIRKQTSYQDVFKAEHQHPKFVHLVLKFSLKARTLVEDYFDEENIQFEADGALMVTVDFPDGEWIYAMILGYGDHVEVLEPPHIRTLIQNKAQKIIEKYFTQT